MKSRKRMTDLHGNLRAGSWYIMLSFTRVFNWAVVIWASLCVYNHPLIVDSQIILRSPTSIRYNGLACSAARLLPRFLKASTFAFQMETRCVCMQIQACTRTHTFQNRSYFYCSLNCSSNNFQFTTSVEDTLQYFKPWKWMSRGTGKVWSSQNYYYQEMNICTFHFLCCGVINMTATVMRKRAFN